MWAIIGLLLISGMGIAGDWQVERHRYGCVRNPFGSEGEARAEAREKIAAAMAPYKAECEADQGKFSVTHRDGFCTPDQGGISFCSSECLVWGYGTCKVATLKKEILLSGGNGDPYLEPGETLQLGLKLENNTASRMYDLRAKISTDKDWVSLAPDELHFGILEPNEVKSLATSVTIAEDAPCGDKLSFTFDVNSFDNRYQYQRDYVIGRPQSPRYFENTELQVGLSQQTATVEIPVDADDVAKVDRLKLRYEASVSHPAYFRAWLKSPDGRSQWVYYTRGASNPYVYEADVSNLFKGAKAHGTWTLSAKLYATNVAGTLNSYKMSMITTGRACGSSQ